MTALLTQYQRLRQTRQAAVTAWLETREAAAELIEAVGESPW